MMNYLKLNYEVEDGGWATASISFDSERIKMTVSYLHDSLGELVGSAVNLVNGAKAARVIFMDEPGEYQLLLKRHCGDDITFELRWFEDWESWGLHPPDKFDVRLQGTTTIWQFREEVLNNLARILEKHGIEGYKEAWGEHDFPLEQYEQLKMHMTKKPSGDLLRR